jgi:hypothetical protein
MCVSVSLCVSLSPSFFSPPKHWLCSTCAHSMCFSPQALKQQNPVHNTPPPKKKTWSPNKPFFTLKCFPGVFCYRNTRLSHWGAEGELWGGHKVDWSKVRRNERWKTESHDKQPGIVKLLKGSLEAPNSFPSLWIMKELYFFFTSVFEYSKY